MSTVLLEDELKTGTSDTGSVLGSFMPGSKQDSRGTNMIVRQKNVTPELRDPFSTY